MATQLLLAVVSPASDFHQCLLFLPRLFIVKTPLTFFFPFTLTENIQAASPTFASAPVHSPELSRLGSAQSTTAPILSTVPPPPTQPSLTRRPRRAFLPVVATSSEPTTTLIQAVSLVLPLVRMSQLGPSCSRTSVDSCRLCLCLPYEYHD